MDKKIILLVEDRQDDIELITEALKEHRIKNKVVVARDGVEAMDYLHARGRFSDLGKKDMPAVILLDLKLPKKDGLEVLREIKENKKTRHIPVIVLTSSKEEKDLIESYDLGCNSYVRKPIDFNDFSEAIKNLGLYWLIINEIPPRD